MLGAFGKSQVCDFSNENVCISERAYATHTLTYVCKFASIAVSCKIKWMMREMRKIIVTFKILPKRKYLCERREKTAKEIKKTNAK